MSNEVAKRRRKQTLLKLGEAISPYSKDLIVSRRGTVMAKYNYKNN